MKKSQIRVLVGIFVILFFYQSFADDVKKKPLYDLSLEELVNVEVYSGSKSNEPLKNIPASVTVITRSEIENHGYLTLDEILRNVPGLYLIDNTESLFIGVRGNLGGGVQFLVNGIPEHPSLQKGLHSSEINQLNIPVEAIDKIEIIRGPMSVIYGNNAFQGTINIVTNEVEEENAIASVTLGNNSTKNFFATYRKSYDNGFFVVNAGNYETDGINGLYSEMLTDEQLSGLHPSAVEKIDGEMSKNNKSAQISFNYKNLSGNFSYKKMEYGFFPTTVGLGGENHINLTDNQGSLVFENSINEFTTYRITGIYSREKYLIPSMSFITPETVGNQTQTSKRNELELNLIHKKGDLEIVTGYRYKLINDLRNRFFIQISPDSKPITDFDRYIDDINTHELFAQFLYKLNSKWQMIAGFRYLRLPSSYDNTTFYYSDNTSINEKTEIDDRNQYTGRIAFMYDISDNNRIKFIVGTAAQDRDEFQFSEPEKISTFEINQLTTFDNFQFSTSIFQNKIRRIIQRSIIVDPVEGNVIDVADNSGKWKTLGIEFMGKYFLNEFYHFGGSFTLQDTKDDEYDIDIGYSPDFLFKAFMEYSNKNINLALNGYYVGKIKTGYNLVGSDENSKYPRNPERLGFQSKQYFLLGTNFRYDFRNGFYININGTNILDKKYFYPATELTTMKNGLIGMGRVVAFTAGFKY